MNELKQGTPLQGGKYIIKRVLGQGGFGITYLAEQVSLGREVAIKEFFMKDNCVRDGETGIVSVPTTGSAAQVEQYRKKFLKEARTLATLDHPNIASVIDVFEENGTVYYSMPYLPGGSLKDLVEKQGPLNEEEALNITRQIAQALKYMHTEHHICHYDVKPDNILFDRNGKAVLIDFGISKNYDSQGKETSITPIGMSEGYAPIEQYQQMVNEFSPSSDVYALGATLYYAVNGIKPPTAVSRISGEKLSFKKGVSVSTQHLIEQAMKLAPNERIQDVDIFIDDNEQEQTLPASSLELEAQPVPNSELESRPVKGHRVWKKVIIGTLALLLSGFLITYIISVLKPRPEMRTDNIYIQELEDNMVYVEGGTFTMGADVNRRTPSQIYETMRKVSNESQVDFGIDNYTLDKFTNKYFSDAKGVELLFSKLNDISKELSSDFGLRTTEDWKAAFGLGTLDEWMSSFGYQKNDDGSYSRENIFDDLPAHQVKLSGYYICKYEVTQELWDAVMNSNPSYFTKDRLKKIYEEDIQWLYEKLQPGYDTGSIDEFKKDLMDDETRKWYYDEATNMGLILGNEDEFKALCVFNDDKKFKLPVDSVSWEECQIFIDRLNQMTGKHYRLPTEAEWEFAARGGNRSLAFSFSGSSVLKNVACFSYNSSSMTYPVGSMEPNELGLYDMSGNVWEWCQDWYGEYPNKSQTNPTGPSSGVYHVYRGGSWADSESYCRVFFRGHKMKSNERSQRLGLRLAMDAK